jgi:hypothetical protein
MPSTMSDTIQTSDMIKQSAIPTHATIKETDTIPRVYTTTKDLMSMNITAVIKIAFKEISPNMSLKIYDIWSET